MSRIRTYPIAAQVETDEGWWNREVVDDRVDVQPKPELVLSRDELAKGQKFKSCGLEFPKSNKVDLLL